MAEPYLPHYNFGDVFQRISVMQEFTAPNIFISGLTSPLPGDINYDPGVNLLYYYNGSSWVTPGGTGTVTNINTTSPLTGGPIITTGTIGITQSTSTQNGYLSYIDWNTFNNKQTYLSGIGVVTSNSGTISYINGTSSQFIKGDGTLDSNTYLTTISGIGAGGDLAGTYPNPTVGINKVTYSKIQQVSADTLLGNPTGSLANLQEISIGSGLALSGTTLISTGSGGTVSSVGLSLPSSIFSISGSPITTSGTLTGTLQNQNANYGLFGPISGSTAQPTFRQLIFNDIPSVIGQNLIGYVSTTGSISSSDSILTAIEKLNGNLNVLTGFVIYKGLWNANTNTPSITTGSANSTNNGWYYKVSVSGTTTVDGISQWNVGDSIISDGITWDKLDGISNEVLSVNGLVGAVPLTGTANQIDISSSNVFSIDSAYPGQTSIITTGTMTTGKLSTGYIIGGVTMTLGSDATGDLYYRNSSGILTRLGIGTSSQYLQGGTIPSWSSISGFVPYTGATANVNIGTYTFNAAIVDIASPSSTSGVLNINGLILDVMNGATPISLTNPSIDLENTVNNFIQGNIRNTSNGNNASSDWIATADTGTDSTNYIDLGINNSAFSQSTWTINGALDGYLYTQSSNLALGTAANKVLDFFTNGTLSANRRMRIDGSGNFYLYSFSNPGGIFYGTSGNQLLQTTSGTTSQVLVGGTTPAFSLNYNTIPAASTLVEWDTNLNITTNNIIEGYATTGTVSGTTVLTVSSAYQQNFTGNSNQTIVLPTVSTLTIGQSYMLMNLGSGTLVVNSSGGNLVQNIIGGASAIFECILTSGTTASSWNVMYIYANNNVGTLINTRTKARVGTTTANTATYTINTDSYDVYRITGQSTNITGFTLTGTPNDSDIFIIELLDSGTPVTITWGSSFESSTVTLPATTTTSTLLIVEFFYNTLTSKFRCVGYA